MSDAHDSVLRAANASRADGDEAGESAAGPRAQDRLDEARQVADAVLFEGYVLYPYTASANKNQLRWQFGVLTPPGSGSTEPSEARTECLIDPRDDDPTLEVTVRFLQVQDRTGEDTIPWQEGRVTEVTATASPARLDEEQRTPFEIPGGEEVDGNVVRRRYPLYGVIRIAAERLPGPYGTLKVRATVENTSNWRPDTPEDVRDGEEDEQGYAERHQQRAEVLRHSLVSVHSLLGVRGAQFLSLLDPPEWAREAARSCENEQTYPVLIGEGRADVLLSSPIILYDYPNVAPESPGDLCDATEIDEILSLRTMALTDEEKQEARATDERAAAIIDHVDSMPQEMLDRLHGAMRYLDEATGERGQRGHDTPGDPLASYDGSVPWWDPGADASVSPETDTLRVPGGIAQKGSRLVLRPGGPSGTQSTDAQDIFVAGRTAEVQAVFFDVEDSGHLAVTIEDDPAADVHQWHGRYLYFTAGEVELLQGSPEGGGEEGNHE